MADGAAETRTHGSSGPRPPGGGLGNDSPMSLIADRPPRRAPDAPPAGTGAPLGAVDVSARELRRRDFLRVFDEQMENLRQDPEAWDGYWAEAELVLTADDID